MGTLYPEFLKKRKIDDVYLGYFMSTWAIFLIITSLITGNILLKYMKRITGVYLGALFVVSKNTFKNLYSFVYRLLISLVLVPSVSLRTMTQSLYLLLSSRQ